MNKQDLICKLRAVLIIVLGAVTLGSNAQEAFGGLALYTVREEMAKDPKATFQKVADAGYRYIEAAGYENGEFYKMSPSDFKAFLKEKNLSPVSTHHGGISTKNADQMMKDAKAAGFQYFVVPIPPQDIFTFDQETRSLGYTGSAENFAQILNSLGEIAFEHGLQLLYHNHDFEFKKDEKGMALIDYLLQNTNPQHVNFEMDLYWVTKAGADPVAYFEKYPGRFVLWHVKDMDNQGRFAPVGEGNIDFQRILAKKEISGMKYYFVEQDTTFGLEPLEAIEVSKRGLREYGFN